MKLLHTADLHLGKRLNNFSLLEDQTHILNEILNIAEEEAVDAVLISGDVYDKPLPPAEAVRLLDDFLVALKAQGRKVFMISGNHDSADRIAFGGRLMENEGIYLSRAYDGNVNSFTLTDEYGPVRFVLLPFIHASQVRMLIPEDERPEKLTYTEAVKYVLDKALNSDKTAAASGSETAAEKRRVLLAHQLVMGSVTSESEEITIGGLDQVSAEAFEGFCYTALGHLHRPQNIAGGKGVIRYAGAPLAYAFSEADHEKSVTIIELNESGIEKIHERALEPLRRMRTMKGTFSDLMEHTPDGVSEDDYLHIMLTDEEEISGAFTQLASRYPNLMKLGYDNTRTRAISDLEALGTREEKDPLVLLSSFYEEQNGQPLSDRQRDYAERVFRKIFGAADGATEEPALENDAPGDTFEDAAAEKNTSEDHT